MKQLPFKYCYEVHIQYTIINFAKVGISFILDLITMLVATKGKFIPSSFIIQYYAELVDKILSRRFYVYSEINRSSQSDLSLYIYNR